MAVSERLGRVLLRYRHSTLSQLAGRRDSQPTTTRCSSPGTRLDPSQPLSARQLRAGNRQEAPAIRAFLVQVPPRGGLNRPRRACSPNTRRARLLTTTAISLTQQCLPSGEVVLGILFPDHSLVWAGPKCGSAHLWNIRVPTAGSGVNAPEPEIGRAHV